ncbi:hypothetical protein J437_LFUL010636 [Ladona fulva]|uniref:CCHC-type domain-containing protein n=1 Tax=Ladona fulva TaxID=123851 RepID=A0A8K0KSX8_LADFU|nr:hypothetical protein J437_LFUL010636 [Ladona fulva]
MQVGEEVEEKYYFILSISRRAVNPSTTNELTLGFRDLFKSVVHDGTDIASVEKFNYLKASLQGKALALIASVPFGDAHYDSAWKELCEHYDNPRILGFDYLDKILEFPVSSSGSLSALQSLAARVVDEVTLALFEETLNDEPFPSVTQLLSFVKKRIKVLQTSFGPRRSLNSKVSSAHKYSHSARVVMPILVSNTHPEKCKGERVTQHCPFCESTHSLEKCPKYLVMNVTNRAGFVRSKKHCFNCLKSGHWAPRCQQKGMCCTICKRYHNTSLHSERISWQRNRSSVQQSSSPGQTPRSLAHLQSQITSTTLSSCVNSHSTYLTVLGTALVHVRNSNGSIVPLHIMVDSRSQVSAISSAAVRRLNLPVSPYHGSLFGLSQTPLRRPEGCVLLSLSPLHNSSPVLNTKSVVLPHLTSKLPPVPLPSFIRSSVSHLYMADSGFDKPDFVDLILGVDLFPKIFLGGAESFRGL